MNLLSGSLLAVDLHLAGMSDLGGRVGHGFPPVLDRPVKVENILKDSLDSIPSPSPSVKIQIMVGKVCLRCKGKTLLDVFKKLLKTRSLLIL